MKQKNRLLIIAEILVIGGILFAFISPLFSPSSESEQSTQLNQLSKIFKPNDKT